MTHTPTSADAVPVRKPDMLASMAISTCLTDARWCYRNRNDIEVNAKRASDPAYAETFDRYLPLGGYIETGAWPS